RTNIKNLIKAEEYIQNIINSSKPIEENITNKKKVLLTMYGWNESGGGTTFPKSLALELVKKGYDVYVFYAVAQHNEVNTPYFLEQTNYQGVNLYGVYNRATNFLDLENPEREIEDPRIIELFEDLIIKISPDIVHYNNFLGLSFAISEIVKKYKIPSIYTPHNYHLIDPKLYMIKDNYQKWNGIDFELNSELIKQRPDLKEQYQLRKNKALKLINNNIDLTIAVSTRQKEILCEFGANPDKIVVVNQIPQLLSYESLDKNLHSPIRFGFLGGVMPHKGVHIILLAAQYLEENEAEIHIYGFITNSYQEILKSIETKCKVVYHGMYKNEDLNDIADQLDIIVIPSIWEECGPLVAPESLNFRLPIIGAKIGGITDFVKDDFNGLLYTYNSPIDLYVKMKKVIKNKELIQKWKNNCKLSYNYNDYVEHISYIYDSLIANDIKSFSNYELKFLEGKKLSRIEYVLDQKNELKLEKINSEFSMVNEINRSKLEKDLPYGFANSDAIGKLPDVLPKPLKLNLGCGKDFKEGFLNFDLYSNNPNVISMDIRNLTLPSNSADYILASDILEHFSHREVDNVLKEWSRVLKPGGTLEIRCPSLKLQLQAYMRGYWNADLASYMIFGGQTNPGDYHCVAFDEHSIGLHLSLAGLEVFDYKEFDFPQEHGYINLNMTVFSRKLALEEIDTDSIKNSQTKQEPSDSNIYGGGSEFDFNEIDQIEQDFEINIPKYEIKWTPNKNYNPQINIVWEGSQFVFHSLALVNREHCSNIIESGQANLTIVPYENDQFEAAGNPKYEALHSNDIRNKEETPQDVAQKPYVWIRHQWPPKDEAPMGAKWIIMQPWEFTELRKDFVEIFNEADEIWTPSNFCRNVFVDSGVEFDKVQVIPNGVDPNLFTPDGDEYPLKTKKKLKFLFVGGTIARKGIDILLSAYLNAFTSQDNVCLVIKDLGGESFYRGQTAQQMIIQAQKTENAPEIEYIDEKLTEQDIANLYRSCDLFISSYRGEGFSLPTLEAMASGLPVVVTRGGATDDYVDESIGWQIPSEMTPIGSNIDGKELTGEAYFLEPNEESLTQILRDIYNNPTILMP
ncbi:MAG: glycosyltransferase, partial [Candidatus Kapabacteria bacterium]|nr:glycosyltransferase [Candidatus Kapabacteria bacterium]